MAQEKAPIITKAEGLEIGAAFMDSLRVCMNANDFSAQVITQIRLFD
jgi:hypothetical protein